MISFPDKKYSIIYADPPWRYSDKGCSGNAQAHYPTMAIDDICRLPVSTISSDCCVLFLWATYPMLQEAFKVIDAWGFTYKSIAFQWIKQNHSGNGYFFGLGRWTRGNTEPCLLATKGKPIRGTGHMVFDWFTWERDGKDVPKIHPTQKPQSVLKKLIETFTDAGDTVIDPCAGSGSTLRAAYELGRNSYGFEISRDFCKLANEKMLDFSDAEDQQRLF